MKTFLSLLVFSVSFPALAFKVGLVLDKGGKDDKSFNTSAYEGAQRAEKELGVELKYVEAPDYNAFENLHRAFAKKETDIIIAIGFAQVAAVKKVAAQFPDRHFVLIDGEAPVANVKSVIFEEHEGSYLVGALAALKSPAKTFGFIGGMDIPLIRRFHMGYEAGVKKIRPDAKVIPQYIGVSGEAWQNPAKAKELALVQYSQGADVIFVAAGASGAGAFDAAEEKKKFAIGVDSNQNWMKPGVILTSMLKRVDNAVFDAIKEAKEGKFKGGPTRVGLAGKGIDYAVDKHNEILITPDMKKKVEVLRAEIIAGKIKVPDYYETQKK